MVQGWHPGEKLIQKKLGYDGVMAASFMAIEEEMPEQHRAFYTTRLPFIPVTILDAQGRPWSCILAGPSGEPGFVSSPREDRLAMDVRPWDGDPFKENIELQPSKGRVLVAGIGIEFSTRRRNKFAGCITDVRKTGDVYQVKLIVNQAIGCVFHSFVTFQVHDAMFDYTETAQSISMSANSILIQVHILKSPIKFQSCARRIDCRRSSSISCTRRIPYL